MKKAFGNPDIDLFASRINKKCHKYVYWKQDPGTIGVDAFNFVWINIHFYVL